MYYKGNNIGLNYDAATGTWAFSNEPQDFIDKSAFSTPDPVFEYATPPTDEDGEEDTNCPEGYVYDNTLKQCIPDPSIQNQYSQQNQGGGQDAPAVQIAGTNRTTANGNFIASREEYEAMSASDLIENLKQRGFVERDKTSGDFVIDLTRGSIAAGFYDAGLKRVGQSSNLQLDKKKNIMSLLIDKGIVDSTTNPFLFARGGMALRGDGTSIPNIIKIPTIGIADATRLGSAPGIVVPGFGDNVFGKLEFDNVIQKKIDALKLAALNTASKYKVSPTTGTSEAGDKAEDIILKEKAKQEEIKTEKEEIKKQQEIEKLKVDNFQPGEDTKREQDRRFAFVVHNKKSKDEAKKDYVKEQAQKMVDKGKETPTGTGQLLGSSFSRDIAPKTSSGKSYTQSKLEQAAKTGRYSGF